MNWINHFLFSLGLLILFFYPAYSFPILLFFSVIFSLFLDFDFILRRIFYDGGLSKRIIERTFLQEFFSIFLVFFPFASILYVVFGDVSYFGFILVPVVSHIVLDYITLHEVALFAPFSKIKYKVGFIIPKKNIFYFEGRFNENHFMILNFIFLILCILSKL